MLQEFRCGGVQERPARPIGAAGFQHQAFIQQTLQHAVAVHTADGIDLRARDRLLVGDDRKGFQRGAAEVTRRLEAEKTFDQFAKLVGASGQVVLADINASMLGVGRDRLTDRGIAGNINFAQCDAQFLPFPDNTFDCITIAFGLRNVTDKDLALASMLRILKPGGRLLVLEFSKPTHNLLEKVYDTYSFKILPFMGKLIANDSESYRYLAESIRMHPDQETLKTMMQNAGFAETRFYNMTGGIVALHKGIKP